MANVQWDTVTQDFLDTPGMCSSCGFLGLWSNSRGLVEADEQFRTTGHSEAPELRELRRPICAALRASFIGELDEYLSTVADVANDLEHRDRIDHPHPVDVLAVIAEESRECNRSQSMVDGWVQWRPGFSPKEHREMLDQQLIREQEHEWRKEDQDWLTSERKARERHELAMERHAEVAGRGQWLGIRLTLLAVVVTAIITLFAAFIGAGWLSQPFGETQPQQIVTLTPTPTSTPPTVTPTPPSPTPAPPT